MALDTTRTTSLTLAQAIILYQLLQGQELSINGSADYAVNGTTKWPGVETTLTFTNNAGVMTIMPAQTADTDNHFQGQPIYGIANQVTGENGTQIAQTEPAGQGTAEPGAAATRLMADNPLSAITKPLQDLFGGK